MLLFDWCGHYENRESKRDRVSTIERVPVAASYHEKSQYEGQWVMVRDDGSLCVRVVCFV